MQIELAVSRAANILQSAAGDTVPWLFNWRIIRYIFMEFYDSKY